MENKSIKKYEIDLEEQKRELLEYMDSPKTSSARNRMGCSEDWYDPQYAIMRTFSREQIEKMTASHIEDLFRLALAIGEGLY